MPVDTPLHKAAHNGDLNQCKAQVEDEGADPNAAGAAERRPLHRAAGNNHVDICTYLIGKGAAVDQADKSGRTSLHWASIGGHKDAAEVLLTNGANIMAVTKTNMSVLHGAAEGGKVEFVRFILERAGDQKEALCNLKDNDQKTPFDLAVAGKHKAVCTVLKELGDPNAQSGACVIC
ncbi:unnamed protein product [Heterosigma akashiwo]|mmetsp:Transcript_25974/g.39049  ORF Transcript_25974/g.39049 Transcript_25974/m.39049 type:complete len:177 (-) Transcript_25974:284-814(-)